MEKNHSPQNSGLIESLLCILTAVYLVCLLLATGIAAFSLHTGEPALIYTRLQWFQAIGTLAAALTIVTVVVFLFRSRSEKNDPAS